MIAFRGCFNQACRGDLVPPCFTCSLCLAALRADEVDVVSIFAPGGSFGVVVSLPQGAVDDVVFSAS